VIGLVYLIYLWFAANLVDQEKRMTLWRTGRVDVPIEGEATC
jgi:hypothetical protein